MILSKIIIFGQDQECYHFKWELDLRYSILFSIFIHFCLFLAWYSLFKDKVSQHNPTKLTWIEVVPNQREKKIEVSKEDIKDKKTRIVQTERASKTDQAKPDAFLGFQNQIVDQQKVSINKIIAAETGSKNNEQRTGDTESAKSSNLNKNNLSKFGLAILPKYSEKQEHDANWATPGTRPQDYVPGMKESDLTALNTKEYLFYSYFQRIRNRLDSAWVPVLRGKLMVYYRNGRHLASDMDHTTRVLVVLNEKGNIVRVKLVSESGTRDLDDAAIEAFNQAGPFPNPPKGMIDVNHEVQIPWDFILKT